MSTNQNTETNKIEKEDYVTKNSDESDEDKNNKDKSDENESNKDNNCYDNDSNRYIVLSETSGGECETWYYFIKYEGNEKALNYLDAQLEKIDMVLLDEMSTFDLDLEHFVCAKTAKEMTQIEVNVFFNRKFDGRLDMINLDLRKKDSNDDMIVKLHEKLGMHQIEDYIDDEDVSDEDVSDNDLSVYGSSDSDGEEFLVPIPDENENEKTPDRNPIKNKKR